MMAFDFFSIASSVKAGSLGREGAAGALSLTVRGKGRKHHKLLCLSQQLELRENLIKNQIHLNQLIENVEPYSDMHGVQRHQVVFICDLSSYPQKR